MDIALVSNPTNSTEAASIQLIRLSGSSSVDNEQQDPSRVWQTTLEKKAVLHDLREVAGAGAGSSKNNVPSPQDVWLQPRLPESLAWSDDGQMFAFAASTSDLKLYSVHDGKPLIQAVPIPCSDPETPLYLLSWQECISSSSKRDKKESSTAEQLEYSLPRLPDVKPSTSSASGKSEKKNTNVFMNPFLPGGNKPFVPSVAFNKPLFPTLANSHPSSPSVPSNSFQADLSDDPDTAAEDANNVEKTHYSPTLLMAGDEKGDLHLLMGGAISMGCIPLLGERKAGGGSEEGETAAVDIISAYVEGTDSKPPTPFNPRHRHTLKVSLLISVPLDTDTSSPSLATPIKECIEALRPPAPAAPPPRSTSKSSSSSRNKSVPPPPAPAETTSKSLVMRLHLHLPNFPSVELTQLARASSGINLLLSNLFEILDDARKSYEEMLEVKKKWLDRLKDDDGSRTRVDLQLLSLLMSGRPPNKNMHEYLASKNTERNLDRWETVHATAVTKLRNLSYRNLTPACERLLLWITQIIGWGKLWNTPSSSSGISNDNDNGMDIQIQEWKKCAELVKIIMHIAEKLEGLVLEEQLGFRDFAGWIRYELERLSAIEAQASARPSPKHDVLAVMTYLKTKLLSNPLDALLKVEEENEVLSNEKGYVNVLERWAGKMVEVGGREYLKMEGEEKLPVVMERLRKMLDQNNGEGQEADMQIEGVDSSDKMTPFQLDCEKMYTDPSALLPPPPIQSVPLTATPSTVNRRKSAITPSTPAPPAPSTPNTNINPTTLPLPAYLQILSSKLSKTLHYSFSRLTAPSSPNQNKAKIVAAKNIILWQPPDRQEDDSMTALGLARDPTKISSRLIRNVTKDGEEGDEEEDGASQHWIACETAPGVLSSSTQEGAFWLTMIDNDDQVHATAFALVQEDGTPLEILDVDFFDDVEVALLIRIPQSQGQPLKYALATVRYREQALIAMPGPLDQSQIPPLEPIPFSRYHAFESGFEPLQFSLNGRKGRRIGCVLGNLGRVLEVLDLDDEEPEEEEEGGDDTAREEEDMQEPDEEFLDDQGGMYQDDDDADAHSFRDGSMLNGQDDDEDPMEEEEEEEDDMDL